MHTIKLKPLLLYAFIAFTFFNQKVCAQKDTIESLRISTIPVQYFFLDFPFIIEKSYKRHTLGVLISYRPSTKSSGEIPGITGLGGEYIYQNYWNPLYNGVTAGFVSKYYLSEKRKSFLEADLFYRFWWFNNKDAIFDNVEGYRFEGTRTERQYIAGLKLLFGSSKKLPSKSRYQPFLDTYFGLGVRYKYYQFETYDGFVWDQYYDYKKDQGNLWLPSLHFGVRIGLNMHPRHSN